MGGQRFYIVFLLLHFTSVSFSQTRADSLISLLSSQKEDTNKVNILNEIGRELYLTESTASMNYATRALTLATKLRFKIGMASAYNSIGIGYYFGGKYPEALKNYIKAADLFEETGYKKKSSAVCNNIAAIFLATKRYEDAEIYFIKSLRIDEELKDRLGMAQSYNNLGSMYDDMKQYEKALEFYFKSLQLRKQINDVEGMPSTLTNIGITYVRNHKPEKGEEYLTESLQLYRKNKDIRGIALAYNNFGDLYKELQQYSKAISYYNKSRVISEDNKFLDYLSYTYNMLSSTHALNGDFVNAYNYHRSYTDVKDSIFNKDNSAQLSEMQTKYETEKKEKELIKTKAESEKQTVLRNAFIAGFIFMLLLAFFIFRGYRNKQRLNIEITTQKQQVEAQKDLIEEKQKEILDSIHYAKRIQQSLMPTEISIEKSINRLRKP